MELIREHLIYKNVPLHICMKDLKPTEHYEVVRFLLATRTKDVHICTHESTNEMINTVLKKLSIEFYSCLRLNQGGNVFPPTGASEEVSGTGSGSGAGSGAGVSSTVASCVTSG